LLNAEAAEGAEFAETLNAMTQHGETEVSMELNRNTTMDLIHAMMEVRRLVGIKLIPPFAGVVLLMSACGMDRLLAERFLHDLVPGEAGEQPD
jgi:hypothetical protein